MKRIINTLTAVLLWIAAAFGSTSCIFDGPGDTFCRTLWTSSSAPLGPLPVKRLTLEFLCGQAISIRTDSLPHIIYGTYESDESTAIFQDLNMTIEDHTVTFIDASLNGDILFLRWRIENSLYPFTTAMHRHTEYE